MLVEEGRGLKENTGHGGMLWIRYSMRYYGVGRVYWSGHGAPPLSFSLFTPCFALASSLSLPLPLFPLSTAVVLASFYVSLLFLLVPSSLSLSLTLLFFSRWRFSKRRRIRLMRGYEEFFFPSFFFPFAFLTGDVVCFRDDWIRMEYELKGVRSPVDAWIRWAVVLAHEDLQGEG